MSDAPMPQPEPAEPRLRDPGLSSLSARDYRAALTRAGRETLSDNIPDVAAALAYYGFLAIPAAFIVALGVFGLVADPSTISSLMDRLEGVVPAEAITLLRDSLENVTKNGGGNLVAVLFGFVLALWTLTGAMSALMRGFNTAYDRSESRGFVRVRLTSLLMLACALGAVALTLCLLVLGPVLQSKVGEALDQPTAVAWVWWTAQWPILIGALLLAFASLLYLGPDAEHPRFELLTPGAVLAVIIWLLVSGGFAIYVATFASYNKAWGSLAAVIVLLTWLWLSSLALLVGAELNAEVQRSRELREGKPSTVELQLAPSGDGHAGEGARGGAAAGQGGRTEPPRRPKAGFVAGAVIGALLAASRLRRGGSDRERGKLQR